MNKLRRDPGLFFVCLDFNIDLENIPFPFINIFYHSKVPKDLFHQSPQMV